MRTKSYAVLTGDLVKSSRMSSEQSTSAMEWLRKLAEKFESVYPNSTISQLDTFRHDSWQWLLAKPELALRAAVFMRTGLRSHSDVDVKFDTRIAIGTGKVESIVEHRISDSRGLAFVRSGKALDAMKKHSRLTYAAERDIAEEEWLAAGLVPLLDCIITDWTPTEARAVHGRSYGMDARRDGGTVADHEQNRETTNSPGCGEITASCALEYNPGSIGIC